jgi:cytochrome P450
MTGGQHSWIREAGVTRPARPDTEVVFDPSTYTDGVPFEALARMRRDTPVAWVPEIPVLGWPEGPGFWLVLGHADVESVLRRPQLFSSALGATQIRDPATPQAEEMLRWWTPVMTFRRTATADCELRGQPIRSGDKVVVSFTSANRDETVFADPDRFDIRRHPNPHLVSGHGPHFCLGAHLARSQMRALFAEVLARTSALVSAGPPSYLRSNFQRGVKRSPSAGPPTRSAGDAGRSSAAPAPFKNILGPSFHGCDRARRTA